MIDILSLEKISLSANFDQDVFCFLKERYYWINRLSGEPWYYHPFRIMKEIVSIGVYDKEILWGSLLHDILEDTDLSYQEFEYMFGRQVFDIVNWLSNLDNNKNKMKKSDYFLKFKSSIHAEWRILFIKIFDCLDNLRTLDNLPIERQICFRKEKREFYLEIFKDNVILIPSKYRNVFVDKISELSQILNVV